MRVAKRSVLSSMILRSLRVEFPLKYGRASLVEFKNFRNGPGSDFANNTLPKCSGSGTHLLLAGSSWLPQARVSTMSLLENHNRVSTGLERLRRGIHCRRTLHLATFLPLSTLSLRPVSG